MGKFTVLVNFEFEQLYEVEADSYDDAEYQAMELAEKWRPYSQDIGIDDWTAMDPIEIIHVSGKIDEDE